ncbi:MAG: TrkA family potassium uptake protein [Chloroflexi bacterium]|nr:TrkA family potassium uptake protein [Chloroflexota bacterium]
MRVVILGCGRVGARLANVLSHAGHTVGIIDKSADAFRRLAPGFRGLTVVGTGIDEDVLRRAGIDQADVFAAVTDADNTNIMASQVAEVIYRVPKVITRIYDPIRNEAYQTLGLETVCPTTLGAERIKQMLERS